MIGHAVNFRYCSQWFWGLLLCWAMAMWLKIDPTICSFQRADTAWNMSATFGLDTHPCCSRFAACTAATRRACKHGLARCTRALAESNKEWIVYTQYIYCLIYLELLFPNFFENWDAKTRWKKSKKQRNDQTTSPTEKLADLMPILDFAYDCPAERFNPSI
jgi:hypothetical protein